MQIKVKKKAWGVVCNSEFLFRIDFFFLGKEVKRNYNRLLV